MQSKDLSDQKTGARRKISLNTLSASPVAKCIVFGNREDVELPFEELSVSILLKSRTIPIAVRDDWLAIVAGFGIAFGNPNRLRQRPELLCRFDLRS